MSDQRPLTNDLTRADLDLLRAAVMEAAEAEISYRSWAGGCTLADLTGSQLQLIPRLFVNLQKQGILDVAGDQAPRLKGAWRHAWAHNQQLMSAKRSTILNLEHAGIVAMLVRQSARLVDGERQDGGLPPLSIVSLLVHPGDSQRSLATLREAGWRFDSERCAKYHYDLATSAPLTGSGSPTWGVDVHWQALPHRAADAALWAHATVAQVRGHSVLVPSTAHQVVLASIEAAASRDDRLPKLADLAVVVTSGPHVPRPDLMSAAESVGSTDVVRLQIARLDDALAPVLSTERDDEEPGTHVGEPR